MDSEDKKATIVNKGLELRALQEDKTFIYLIDRVAQVKETFKLDDATDWSDYKFRLGVIKGLSLLEEISGTIIQRADRLARGKQF